MGDKVVKRGSVKHSFVGRHYILSKRVAGDDYRNLALELIAYAIGAHHGLFDCVKDNKESAFSSRLDKKDERYKEEALKNYFSECRTEEEIEQLLNGAIAKITKTIEQIIAMDTKELDKCEIPFYYGLLCRLITSAVIYGDRRDTGEFCKNKMENSGKIDWHKVLEKFNAYISSFKNIYEVDSARKEISQACADAAKNEEGIYRLNLPTGSGKTLSSVRCALEHSQLYHKKRIIFVMPLLSIIEQNAKEIRKAIQDDSIILEHHSNVVNEKLCNFDKLEKKELLTLPWDAPIIITTLVQFLNTLYSDRTSSIKRFVSLSDSVIVFDEVQSVPNNMLTLFNLAVNFLAKICHATVILCSATQPCFEKAEHKMLHEVKNLIALPTSTLKVFKRVKLVDKGAMTMEELTDFALEIIAKRMIVKGGRRDVFLGTRECQAYVEPCIFGEGEGAYDVVNELAFGVMYHGITYPDEAYSEETRDCMTVRFWRPVMKQGVIEFVRPEACPINKQARPMKMKKFVDKENFSGLEEFDTACEKEEVIHGLISEGI